MSNAFWNWTNCENPKQVLDSLFPKDKNAQFTFIAGSGISLDPPSNLPTGYMFTHELMRRLVPESEFLTILE